MDMVNILNAHNCERKRFFLSKLYFIQKESFSLTLLSKVTLLLDPIIPQKEECNDFEWFQFKAVVKQSGHLTKLNLKQINFKMSYSH